MFGSSAESSSNQVLFARQRAQHGAAHHFQRRPLARPYFPLRRSLRDKHFHARNRFDAAQRRELHELCNPRPVNQIENQPAIDFPRRAQTQTDAPDSASANATARAAPPAPKIKARLPRNGMRRSSARSTPT